MALLGQGSRTATAGRIPRGTESLSFFLVKDLDPIIFGTAVSDEGGTQMLPNADVELQFRRTDPQGVFTRVVAGSGDVRMTENTSLTDTTLVTASERLTTGLTGVYVPGREVTSDGLSTQAGLVLGNTVEFQWALDFSNAVRGFAYDFRVRWTTLAGVIDVIYDSLVAPTDPIIGDLVFLWDTFNRKWGIGLVVLAYIGTEDNRARILMVSEETFARIYDQVPKFTGFAPGGFTKDDIVSRWTDLQGLNDPEIDGPDIEIDQNA